MLPANKLVWHECAWGLPFFNWLLTIVCTNPMPLISEVHLTHPHDCRITEKH